MRELILIHGRSQQNKVAAELKKVWVAALHKGMTNAGLQLRIDDQQMHFPYYGDTLIQMIKGSETVTSVSVKGGRDTVSDAEAQLLDQVVWELLAAKGISKGQVSKEQTPKGAAVTQKGPLNWGLTLAGLRKLNDLGFGTLALELCTRDVYRYVKDENITKRINQGVAGAFNDHEAVVVAHSLGTVVAYSMLSGMGGQKGWRIPTFITLGSPLAIRAVNQLIPSIGMPSCVRAWCNGRDPKDTVALFPLAPVHFPDLGIIAKNTIDNRSKNHHSVVGYLGDPDVAHWIHSALTK